MAKPTERNVTGVESFDHSIVKHLPEYHAAREALDNLVHAINSELNDEQPGTINQAKWLKIVEQMAASLQYMDSSEPCSCEWQDRGAWPYKVEIDERNWLFGHYRCPHCRHEWTCGYTVNIGVLQW
jgi:hypothetical protein